MKICIDFGSGGGVTLQDMKMLHYLMIAILVFAIGLFIICDVIPWIQQFIHSTLCSVPNWPVAGGCP